ncbi:MAG: proline--tRNA ligase [Bacillota bacterium]|nr:proline--tRNA ligase [Bacillota bacterium]
MKMSQMHIHTLREVPTEAEIDSHILMLRAGMIKKLVSGVYNFMPFGRRVVNKMEQIVREEMDAKGAQEILCSALHPAELWEESGRWYKYGPELFRLKDRADRDFCLGPTHEEVFTAIVRDEVSSHRQLPLNLYQIQTKYRDEKRPRFGLMRGREFIMKDAYSFDRDKEGLEKSYDDMYDAYERVFTRCDLNFRAVEADNGAIGGSASHEFCALSAVGESEIGYCDDCDVAATTERFECVDDPEETEEMKEPVDELTPECKTIEDVAEYLGLPATKTLKALMYKAEGNYYVAFVRGDRELNETKLINAINVPEFALEFAEESEIEEILGGVAGFTGPVGLKNCTIVVDSEVTKMRNLCAGANKEGYHTLNLNYGRDYKADIVCDLKLVKEGYTCPKCGGKVKLARGTEVGQVFKLGTKYSESMGAYFRDENMQEQLIEMGCYGIGITRTPAAVVEQYHDEDGIIWPVSLAPYHVVVTVVNIKDETQMKVGMEIHDALAKEGIEVLIDDRDERVGVKFKDADLIGFPVRITVGKKAGEDVVEYKLRKEADITEMSKQESIDTAVKFIRDELVRLGHKE